MLFFHDTAALSAVLFNPTTITMKKALLAVLFAAICSTPALAEQHYISGSVGYGTLNESGSFTYNGATYSDVVAFDSGTPWEIAIGSKVDEYRIETALGYQANTVDTVAGLSSFNGYSFSQVEIATRSIMVNAYRDFTLNDSEIAPYVMAGLGSMNLKLNISGTDYGDVTKFAWQLGVGLGFKASDNITLDLGYRYFAAADVTFPSPAAGYSEETYSVGGSRVLVGLRYGF
jgi:opacity protein-like surface antigen